MQINHEKFKLFANLLGQKPVHELLDLEIGHLVVADEKICRIVYRTPHLVLDQEIHHLGAEIVATGINLHIHGYRLFATETTH